MGDPHDGMAPRCGGEGRGGQDSRLADSGLGRLADGGGGQHVGTRSTHPSGGVGYVRGYVSLLRIDLAHSTWNQEGGKEGKKENGAT